jgi:hypothetical protein
MEELNDLLVYGIVSSKNNTVWLSTNQGIYKLNTVTQEIHNYGIQHGSGASNFNPNSFLQRSNGEIWFGSVEGITVIHPGVSSSEVPLRKINLVNLLLNDEPVPWLECALTGSTNINELMKIKLPYRDNTVRLEFTAIDYAGPYHPVYLYRMVGVDDHWIESKAMGSVRYANLEHGEYTFIVKAKNHPAGQQAATRVLKIDIQAPLYQRGWFVQLMLLLFFLIILLSVRLYTKRKEKFQQLVFEKRMALESERLRIANDMYDDLGSGLSALSLKAKLMAEQPASPELQTQLKEIAGTANRLTQTIRETIWTISSKNDTIDNLVTHLHQYGLDYFNGTPVDCQVEIMQEQILTSIPGSHRRELYLAFKEALHNIIRILYNGMDSNCR